jgi:hypothetical protein
MNAPFSLSSEAIVHLQLNAERSFGRRTKMKTIIATAALTIMFLSAGAFAGNHHRMVQTASIQNFDNVTVVAKNSAWPVLLEGEGTGI